MSMSVSMYCYCIHICLFVIIVCFSIYFNRFVQFPTQLHKLICIHLFIFVCISSIHTHPHIYTICIYVFCSISNNFKVVKYVCILFLCVCLQMNICLCILIDIYIYVCISDIDRNCERVQTDLHRGTVPTRADSDSVHLWAKICLFICLPFDGVQMALADNSYLKF